MYRIIIALALSTFTINTAFGLGCFATKSNIYQVEKVDDSTYRFFPRDRSDIFHFTYCAIKDQGKSVICEGDDDVGGIRVISGNKIVVSETLHMGTPDEPILHHFEKDKEYELIPCQE